MTKDDSTEKEVGWIMKPADRGTISVNIDVGEGAEITPKFRESLEKLIDEISKTSRKQDAIVMGLPSCNPLKMQPCAVLVSCRIGI